MNFSYYSVEENILQKRQLSLDSTFRQAHLRSDVGNMRLPCLLGEVTQHEVD